MKITQQTTYQRESHSYSKILVYMMAFLLLSNNKQMLPGSFREQFVYYDCFCYICLYQSIRGSNWELRVSSLKQMVPFFAKMDRTTYERIIPNHLADIYTYLETVLKCLKSGGLTANIRNRTEMACSSTRWSSWDVYQQGPQSRCCTSNWYIPSEEHTVSQW